jgi:hypothetical protein
MKGQKHRIAMAVFACCSLLTVIYYPSIRNPSIILDQLNVPVVCGGGELGGQSLTITVKSNDVGKTLLIETANETAVSLSFENGGPFSESLANAAGQRLDIYDGNFQLHNVFRSTDIFCEMR